MSRTLLQAQIGPQRLDDPRRLGRCRRIGVAAASGASALRPVPIAGGLASVCSLLLLKCLLKRGLGL